MKYSLLALLGLAAQASAANLGKTYAPNSYYHVECESSTPSKCSVHEGKESATGHVSHAYGMFNDDIEKEGWGKLWVHGDESTQGYYEAGFLEGALTSLRIYQHFHSWYAHQQSTSPVTPATEQFLVDQYEYAWSLVDSNPSTDPYYARLGQVLTQYEGILTGLNYAAAPGYGLSHIEFLMTNGAGDLYDIIPATTPSAFKLKIGRPKDEFVKDWHEAVSCSAMIKITDDLQDVNLGHTTWTSYVNMLRIFKHYSLNGGSHQVSFSAKPGVIYSKDDFYVLPRPSQHMAVMETTNGVMDQSLYEKVTHKTLLTWQRIPLTNSLVDNGKDWVETFNRHQSGTYINQWMVVDMKKFVPGKGATEGFLWITESIPGFFESADVTPVMLSLGNVWPSYNVPFFKSVYIISGFQKAYEEYGSDNYSYDMCYRAQMMRRDHSSIQSIEAMGAELRRNDYITDPLANGSPDTAIAPRKDLLPDAKRAAWGGIDSKVTSYSRVTATPQELEERGIGVAIAQSGPTHQDPKSLPPFDWRIMGNATETHLGQPDVFNFGFVEMKAYAH